MGKSSGRELWIRITGWFLAVSYGVGAPYTAILEYRRQVLSQHFGIPAELVYVVSVVQVVCALGVLVKPLMTPAAAALTLTTLGAIALHLKIGSPLTAWTAVLYTAVQVWFGLAHRAGRQVQK